MTCKVTLQDPASTPAPPPRSIKWTLKKLP